MKTSFALFFLLLTTLLCSQTPRLVVPTGHADIFADAAFLSDGKHLLTNGFDGSTILWDLNGRQVQTFKGPAIRGRGILSPDGKHVLTGGDSLAELWDLNGRQVQTFKGHTKHVESVAFSPDGKRVLTGSWDGTAILWDLNGRQIQTFIGHIGGFPYKAFSPDGRHFGGVSSVAFSPDGKHVLTGGRDSTAILWDLNGRQVQTFKGLTSRVESVAFSPDGKHVLTGSWDGTAILWDLNGRQVQTFKGLTSRVESVAFSPDGKHILISSEWNEVILWDLNGQQIQTFKGSFLAFSPDGQRLLTSSRDRTANLWNLNGQHIQTFKGHTKRVESVALSPDGKYVLTGSSDSTAKLWDLNGRQLQTFKGHAGTVASVAFSPDGKHVLTGGIEGTAELWDLNGRQVQTFKGGIIVVASVAFSPDGKHVLTCGPGSNTEFWEDKSKAVFSLPGDLSAILWDLNGQQVQTFKGLTEPVLSGTLSPDGKYVLTGIRDETAVLWDLNGQQVQTFKGHIGPIGSVAFSPDRKHLLTGGDSLAVLWDLNGRQIQTFKGHTNWVTSLAFSPDGKYVLTGSGDRTAILWDLNGREVKTFNGHTYDICSVAFSPDGKIILTGSLDHTVKLWDISTGTTLATLFAIDSTDWVVTTPSGLFDASPGAMQLMYFVVGLEVIELEQLKERYYEPGLLQKIMGFSDEPLRSVSGFDSVALYPTVELQLDTLQNKLHIHLQPRNGGTGKVSVFITGKEIIPDANPEKGYEKIRDTIMTIELERFQNYFLFDSLNVVSVRAYNQAGWLKSAAKSVAYRPAFARSKGEDKSTGSATTRRLNRKPALFAVVVGTANYAGSQLDLKYSAKDAQDMASALEQIGGQLFGKFGPEYISVQLLSTDTSHHAPLPTKANIRTAFEKIKSRAKAEDILVVYFSGHGVSYGDADQALFYYLTMDIGSENLTDAGVRAGRTVSSEELTRWINDIPAQKQVLILDACNSGRVVENLAAGQKELNSSQIRALDRMKDRTGMFVLTGSAADKVSYEAGQYGQGLLTYSLLQGMSGLALTADKRVDVSTLFEYTRDVVPQLARGIGGVQTPMMVGPLRGSFDIGVVNEKVQIPLAQVKPVFIRNNFQEEKHYDDVLGLTKALAEHFQQITVRGAQADLIYVDVNEYENAYSIKGRYTITQEDVQVRGYLFEGKTPVGEEFKVSGKKDNIPALAEAIVDKVALGNDE